MAVLHSYHFPSVVLGFLLELFASCYNFRYSADYYINISKKRMTGPEEFMLRCNGRNGRSSLPPAISDKQPLKRSVITQITLLFFENDFFFVVRGISMPSISFDFKYFIYCNCNVHEVVGHLVHELSELRIDF